VTPATSEESGIEIQGGIKYLWPVSSEKNKRQGRFLFLIIFYQVFIILLLKDKAMKSIFLD
jgi:hypothetical protein